jgi:hypothetical protein
MGDGGGNRRVYVLTAIANMPTKIYYGSTSGSTNDLIRIVRQAQLIFIITFEATCFDLFIGHLQAFHCMKA